MGNIILMDGSSILKKAFQEMPDLTDRKGRHISAVRGFMEVFFLALEGRADAGAPVVVFGREEEGAELLPLELASQKEALSDILHALHAPVLKEDQRAEDLLYSAALAWEQEKKGDVLLVTGRERLLQAATEHTAVAFPKRVNGTLTLEILHAADVEEKTGLSPEKIPLLLALAAEAEDKEKKVLPGIGKATAAELVRSYGTAEELYAHLDQISGANLRSALEKRQSLLPELLEKVTFRKDLPVTLSSLTGSLQYTVKARALLRAAGAAVQLPEMETEEKEGAETDAAAGDGDSDKKAAPAAEKILRRTITERKDAEEFFARAESVLGAGGTVGIVPVFDVPHLELPRELLGLAAAVGSETVWIPVNGTEDPDGAALPLGQLSLFDFQDEHRAPELVTTGYLSGRLAGLRRAARDAGKDSGAGGASKASAALIAVFDIKSQYPFWGITKEEFHDGIRLQGIFDTLIGAYLLNPLKSDYQPENIAGEYCGESLATRKELLGKGSFAEKLAADPKAVEQYAEDEAQILAKAAPLIQKKLEEEEMAHLYRDVELPLSYILYDMQRIGIRIVPEKLKAYGDRLTGRIAELDAAIHRETGDPDFNIASPKQLGEILFDRMQLPGGKKTKSGWSTSADILEKLAPDYPVVADVLEYRALTKLKSTYADGLAAYVAGDSRIHTTFNQTITATGRISSTDPNLQNIPMRTELGREIRKVFIPRDGWSFTDSDYSQIELRILASMSGDEALIEAYRGGRDIHRMTASKVFNTPFDEVTDLQRRNAKAVNFGIVYGISSFGLSQGLSISRKEAQEYINQYFRMFPGIKTFLDRQVQDAKTRGYSVTMMGRRRPIPELKESNYMRRQFGERVAMNAPIQGTGADIMKVAMIRVWEMLHKKDMQSQLILQIHDELLIETAPGEEQEVMDILKEGMMGAADLKVSLEVDCHNGSDWYEAK